MLTLKTAVYQLTCLRDELEAKNEQLEKLIATPPKATGPLIDGSAGRALACQISSGTLWYALFRRPPLLRLTEAYWTTKRCFSFARRLARDVKRRLRYSAASKASSEEGTSSQDDLSAPCRLRLNPNFMPEPHFFADLQSPRILIDVSQTAISPSQSGIQRYVRRFATEAVQTGAGLPVIIRHGRMYAAYEPVYEHKWIGVEPGDILLLLDANWTAQEDGLEHLVRELQRNNGRIITFFHDVIPLSFPFTCARSTIVKFKDWFEFILPRSHALITSTGAGAQAIKETIDTSLFRGMDLPVGWVGAPSGLSDSAVNGEAHASSISSVSQIFDNQPVFISVGTIEPRKGYGIALDAFEWLWRRGLKARYLIIGKTGWNMSHLERRIKRHPLYGVFLFWLEACDDDDLVYCYKHAHRLIMCSIEEGYGMPLLESALFGLPAICSDIPVFHDVALDARTEARFFEPANVDELCVQILESIDVPRAPLPNDRAASRHNVDRMIAMIRNAEYQGNTL